MRCVAFAPPGGMLTRGVAAASRAFTTSVFVENDVVPTLSLAATELLRDELLHALCFSRASKAAIAYDVLASALCGCTRRRAWRVHAPPPPLCTEGNADADGLALAVDWESAGDPPLRKPASCSRRIGRRAPIASARSGHPAASYVYGAAPDAARGVPRSCLMPRSCDASGCRCTAVWPITCPTRSSKCCSSHGRRRVRAR